MSVDAGTLLARVIRDPRNLTKEEWRHPLVAALYDSLSPQEWALALAEAKAQAINDGRIATGPGEHRDGHGLRRIQRLIAHDNGFRKVTDPGMETE